MSNVHCLQLNVGQRTSEITLEPSCGPTEQEKLLSKEISEMIYKKHEEAFNKLGYIRINYDINLGKNHINVKGVSCTKESGDVVYEPIRFKFRINGNILTTTLRRVGIAIMPGRTIEQKINFSYRFPMILLGICALISGISLFVHNFIPTPIDKALFWTSIAGTVGFFFDDWKRKFK